jgi:hypothetical protein
LGKMVINYHQLLEIIIQLMVVEQIDLIHNHLLIMIKLFKINLIDMKNQILIFMDLKLIKINLDLIYFQILILIMDF